uniref:Uncharacterized protein n=1 Tax=Panagrolaimus davidi TaxID=227884 RepID=A0A914PQV0_9BILA
MRRSARIAALNATSTSTKPNRKRKVVEIIAPIKRQNWLFRDSLINYITKSPSNSKAWQKLIQSCKYFFAKNPVFVFDKLEYKSKKWMVSLNETKKRIDFTKILIKLWITDKFDISNDFNPPINVSLIIPKLYKVDAKYLRLVNVVISFKDFSFLSSNVLIIVLRENVIKDSDDSIVPLEKLIAILPKIKIIDVYDKIHHSSCITKNTVKDVLKIPQFSKIDRFELFHIKETFDIETFFTYLKKNKHAKFELGFSFLISEDYDNRIEAIVDEIIETEEHDYKIPKIYFVRMNIEKQRKLLTIRQN